MSQAFSDRCLVGILRAEERIHTLLVHAEEGVVINRVLLDFGRVERSRVDFLGLILV